MTDNQLSSIPPMPGMAYTATQTQNIEMEQNKTMVNSFMDIPAPGISSAQQQPVAGMTMPQAQVAQEQESSIPQFHEIPQQPSMNMDTIPQQSMNMPQSVQLNQDFASAIPSAMTNETQNFSTPPNLNIVPESPSIMGGMPGMNTQPQQTFFTPSEVNQPVQEPLRGYVEEKKGITSAAVFMIALFSLVLGIFFGVTLFGKEEVKKIEGLQGVVRNPDLEGERLQRCGQAEKGRACVLYVFNHTHYDRTVDSFFDEVVRLTEISKYSIAMVNAQYAKTLIRPGAIAEIKVPAQN